MTNVERKALEDASKPTWALLSKRWTLEGENECLVFLTRGLLLGYWDNDALAQYRMCVDAVKNLRPAHEIS